MRCSPLILCRIVDRWLGGSRFVDWFGPGAERVVASALRVIIPEPWLVPGRSSDTGFLVVHDVRTFPDRYSGALSRNAAGAQGRRR